MALFFLALAAGVGVPVVATHAARRRGCGADPRVGAELLVRGALLMSVVLIVFNKVGSPQYIGWLAPPVAVALALRLAALAHDRAARRRRSRAPPSSSSRGATTGSLAGRPADTLVLVARNVALVVLLVAHRARAAPSARSSRRTARGVTRTAATNASSAARDVPSSIAESGSDSSSVQAADASSGPASAR